jgi:hypothetical protein
MCLGPCPRRPSTPPLETEGGLPAAFLIPQINLRGYFTTIVIVKWQKSCPLRLSAHSVS